MRFLYAFVIAVFGIGFSGCQSTKTLSTPSVTEQYRIVTPDMKNIDEPTKYIPKKDDEFHITNYKQTELLGIIEPYLGTRQGGDCSGFVELVNNKIGNIYFDPSDLDSHYSNSRKSKAMYNYYEAKNGIFKDKIPKVGDLVFFHNTLKAPKKLNESNITHVGIVYKIEKDGTVHFANHLSGKNTISALNLKKSVHTHNGKEVNSYMKRCGKKESRDRCLAYGLFAGFADADINGVALNTIAK